MTISDLPPEVLGEIFHHCSKLWPDAPLTLSRVSRSFYSATVTTARAWTYLQLFFSPLDEVPDSAKDGARCGRKAELWFSRAGVATPLNVLVDMGPCLVPPQSMALPFSEHRLVFSSLPLVLRRQVHRINSLTLHAPTFETAHHFLTTVYGTNTIPNSVNPNDAPRLRNLTLDIVREMRRGAATHTASYSESPNPEKPLVSSSSSSSSSSSHFTSLQHLEITNHALPYLSHMIDMSEMRTLVITGPLRAAPLTPSLVLDILRRATKLNRLEFESRLLPDKTHWELLSPMHGEDQTSKAASIIPTRGKEESLIALKELTHLSIRTNNVPALLAYLVLPQLQTLSIEDVDGRRPNAAYETGLVLFHLLVRMDVQCGGGGGGGVGLKELRDTGSTRKSVTTEPDDGHLRWCFRKMKDLQRIRAKNVNIEALFGLLSQVPNAGNPCRLDKVEVDEGVAEGRVSVVSNHLEGFGFGSSFDRSRRMEFNV